MDQTGRSYALPINSLPSARGLGEPLSSKLAPANGTYERYKLQEWLTFIGTELHKGFSPLFNPATPEETKAATKERLLGRLKWVDGELAGKQYLMGDSFSVADLYLTVFWTWGRGPVLGYDMPADFPKWTAHARRVAERRHEGALLRPRRRGQEIESKHLGGSHRRFGDLGHRLPGTGPVGMRAAAFHRAWRTALPRAARKTRRVKGEPGEGAASACGRRATRPTSGELSRQCFRQSLQARDLRQIGRAHV